MAASTITQAMTTQELASRFYEYAKKDEWFEIQDEFFSDNVKSIDPPNSPWFDSVYAEGKIPVRKKGEEFVKKIEAVHKMYTTAVPYRSTLSIVDGDACVGETPAA
jgi:hypothetical protein